MTATATHNHTARIVAAYDYRDERGVLLYQVVRYEPGLDGEKKTFRQRRPVGKDKWEYNLGNSRRVLYRLPELLAAADLGRPVFVVEGEKDADRLVKLGLVATTNAMGAGKWRSEYGESLRGRHVVILPDNDDPGRQHAQAVAVALHGTAASIKTIEFPGLPPKGDVSDWLDAGGSKENLLTIASRGQPWQPPPAQAAAAGPEPWEPPIPLTEDRQIEPFPVDVLPTCLAQFVKDAAEALVCPPDYVAVPMLAIAGAAIGSSRALQVKASYFERPCLYAAVVGPPGGAKSPALKLVASPVYSEQARLANLYAAEKIAFEEADSQGRKPSPKTIYVSDITTEALAVVLQANPHGVALIRDELTAWVASLDQYKAKGRGTDRQFFLAAWAGEPVSVHRKNQDDGPVFVPHPFVTVVGCLPPDMLSRLRGEKNLSDGFLDRDLFTYPEPMPIVAENWRCVSDEGTDAWKQTLEYLWALKQDIGDNGTMRPHFVRLTTAGREAWERFTGRIAQEVNQEDFPEFLRGPWSKLRGYCARVALIVHFLRLAAGEPETEDVDEVSLDKAAKLIRYFQSHARKVYAVIDADRELPKAKRVLAWIVREQRQEFKQWEPFKDMRSQGEFPQVESLDRPLDRLVKHRFIRPKEIAGQQGRGRPPAQVFEVNPSVHLRVNPVNPPK
jgi:hypothetical protein